MFLPEGPITSDSAKRMYDYLVGYGMIVPPPTPPVPTLSFENLVLFNCPLGNVSSGQVYQQKFTIPGQTAQFFMYCLLMYVQFTVPEGQTISPFNYSPRLTLPMTSGQTSTFFPRLSTLTFSASTTYYTSFVTYPMMFLYGSIGATCSHAYLSTTPVHSASDLLTASDVPTVPQGDSEDCDFYFQLRTSDAFDYNSVSVSLNIVYVRAT
jgi:hypothetical protein